MSLKQIMQDNGWEKHPEFGTTFYKKYKQGVYCFKQFRVSNALISDAIHDAKTDGPLMIQRSDYWLTKDVNLNDCKADEIQKALNLNKYYTLEKLKEDSEDIDLSVATLVMRSRGS